MTRIQILYHFFIDIQTVQIHIQLIGQIFNNQNLKKGKLSFKN